MENACEEARRGLGNVEAGEEEGVVDSGHEVLVVEEAHRLVRGCGRREGRRRHCPFNALGSVIRGSLGQGERRETL